MLGRLLAEYIVRGGEKMEKEKIEVLRQLVSQYEQEHGSLTVCITDHTALNCRGGCANYCVTTCKGSCEGMCKTHCGMGVG